MAAKTNIRSIRFTDEMAELIDRQPGDNFSAKFEALVTRCVWELPAAEAELERVNEKIRERREEFRQLYTRASTLSAEMRSMEYKAKQLEEELQKAIDLMA